METAQTIAFTSNSVGNDVTCEVTCYLDEYELDMSRITMRPVNDATSKVARHRERMRAAGLRPVQFWVQDTRSPEFIAQIRQQCLNLREDPAEAAILKFTEEAASNIESWE